MRPKVRIAAVVGLALSALVPVTAAGGTPSPVVSRTRLAAGTAPALWYVNHNESLRLRVSATKTLRLSSPFESFSDPQWSARERLLSYSEITKSKWPRIRTVTATGVQQDRFSCHCFGQSVWRGRSLVTMHQHQIVVRDPRSHTTHDVRLTGAHFRNGSDITTYPNALVAAGRSLVFSAATHTGSSAYGGPESLFVATANGHVRKLHAAGGNTEVFDPRLDARGTHVAYVTEAHAGFCADYPLIGIVNLRTGSVSHPRLPHLNRPWALLSLRYRGNRLYAGLAATPKGCVHGGATKSQITVPSRYRVTPTRLVHPTRGLVDEDVVPSWVAKSTGKVKVDGGGGYPGSKLVITDGSHRVPVTSRAYHFGWL